MSADVSKEVMKILVEKRILFIDGKSVSFSKNFLNTIMKCVYHVVQGKKILKIKTLDDIILQSINNAVMSCNLDLGLKLSDAEYEEESITCWALIKVKYLDSIKNTVKQDIKLCKMLEKNKIKIQ